MNVQKICLTITHTMMVYPVDSSLEGGQEKFWFGVPIHVNRACAVAAVAASYTLIFSMRIK